MTSHPHDPGADDADPLFDIEAEQALIGALLVNNSVFDRVNTIVSTDDFGDPVHADVWASATDLIIRGEGASPIALRHRFADHPGLAELGGPAYLVRLAGAAISLFACADYARMVADLARRRALRQTLQEGIRSLTDLDTPAEAAAGKVETWSLAEAERGRGDNVISMRKALTETVRQVNEAHMSGGTPGLRCGIRALDDVTGGFSGSDMVVIGGRPSMGKSALAQQIALNVARGMYDQEPVGVGIVSIEMNEVQIALRALSERTARMGAGIPYHNIRNAAALTEDEVATVIHAARDMENLPIFITPPEVNSVGSIMAACRHMVRRFEQSKQKLGLLVIDYIQLMEATSRGNRTEQVTELSNSAKRLGRKLGVPVLALAQLSRALEQRDDPRPHLGDLRESGAIEQDADTVIFPFREEYYLSKARPRASDPANPTESESKKLHAWHAAMAASAGQIDLIVAKQRMGPTTTVKAACSIELNWIRDRDDYGRNPPPDMEGFA